MSSRNRSRYNQSASCFAHSEKQRFFEPEKDAELNSLYTASTRPISRGLVHYMVWISLPLTIFTISFIFLSRHKSPKYIDVEQITAIGRENHGEISKLQQKKAGKFATIEQNKYTP